MEHIDLTPRSSGVANSSADNQKSKSSEKRIDTNIISVDSKKSSLLDTSTLLKGRVKTIHKESRFQNIINTFLGKKEDKLQAEFKSTAALHTLSYLPTVTAYEMSKSLDNQPVGTYILRQEMIPRQINSEEGEGWINENLFIMNYINEDRILTELMFRPVENGFQEVTSSLVFPNPNEILDYAKKQHPTISFIPHELNLGPKVNIKTTSHFNWPSETALTYDLPDLITFPLRVFPRRSGLNLLKQAESTGNSQQQHGLYDLAATRYIEQEMYPEAFLVRAHLAEKDNFSEAHPLYDLEEAIEEQSDPSKPDFGSHFSHFGGSELEDGHLTIYKRDIDGKVKYTVQFNLNLFAKEKLQKSLRDIITHADSFTAALNQTSLKDASITITESEDIFLKRTEEGKFSRTDGYSPGDSKVLEIHWEGVGRILIGNSPNYGNLYRRVQVEIDADLEPGEGLKKIHQLTSILGIGPILYEQEKEDIERRQIAAVFRAFHPAAAAKMENDIEFFTYSVQNLKKVIIRQVPEMKQIFEIYLGNKLPLQRLRLFDAYFPDAPDQLKEKINTAITKDEFIQECKQCDIDEDQLKLFLADWENPNLLEELEIYKGKVAWAIKDLPIRMRAKGSCGLMHGMGYNFKKQTTRAVARILQFGLFSSEDRFSQGSIIKGQSSDSDLSSGGGDQVFCREINEKILGRDDLKIDHHDFPSARKFQFLINLDIVSRTGTYAYPTDEFGVKNPFSGGYYAYEKRKNLIEFTEINDSGHNEVMISNRISSEFIVGITCQSEEAKAALIETLEEEMLISIIEEKKYIQGKPVDAFIHVTDKFDRKFWQESEEVAKTT